MRILILGALCAPLLSVGHSARAQVAASATALPAAKTGYELLMEPKNIFWNGPNGYPSSAYRLKPDENLKRQRAAVAANAPVLATLRAALEVGIEAPPAELTDFSFNARVREFARQLWQEAAVRAADGDVLGAAQSSLDGFELARQVERGSIVQSLVASAVSSLMRDSLQKNAAPGLDAAQLRQVAQKWQSLDAPRASFAEILGDDAQYTRRLIAPTLTNPEYRAEFEAKLAQPETRVKGKDEEYSHDEIRQILALSPAQFEASNRRLFDAAIAHSALPYQTAVAAAPVRASDPLSKWSAQTLNNPLFRLGYESNALSDRFGIAALRLRAIKLESGAYPEQFDAGADPFSPTLAPLIYRREDDTYLLYSVGPDGTDDKGAPILSVETDDETGVESVTNRLQADSSGDIVAPVF